MLGKGVTILFTNDAHTHVDNRKERGLRYSQIAWLKKACAEKEPTFLVDAGDYLQGTAYGAGVDAGLCRSHRACGHAGRAEALPLVRKQGREGVRSGSSGFSMLTNSVPVGFYGGMELDVFQFAAYLKSFRKWSLTSENSTLYGRGYAEAIAYERPCGGERIRFVAVKSK